MAQAAPLISVIVPVYRTEAYLDRCVDSILNQSYDTLELILVDDGSPDRCGALCDAWATKDPRVRVIHRENGGLSVARNTGIEAAGGEYLCFVDSDDFIRPAMLETLLRLIREHGVTLALCGFSCVDERGARVFPPEDSPIRAGVFPAEDLYGGFYEKLGWAYIVAWNKLYHRSLFDGLRFPPGKVHEDEFVAAQLFAKAGRIACTDEELLVYTFLRRDGITARENRVKYPDFLAALAGRFAFYRAEGLARDAAQTRAVYFRSLETLVCEPGRRAGLTKEQWRGALADYRDMPDKTRNERLRWLLFRLCPRAEVWLIRRLRSRKNL